MARIDILKRDKSCSKNKERFTVRKYNFLAAITLLVSPFAHAEFNYITVDQGKSVSVGMQCPGHKESISLVGGKTSISNGDHTYALPLDELSESKELFLGYDAVTGICTLGVPYAKSDTNESYSFFVYSVTKKQFVQSAIKTIVNPDFSEGNILSSYRDGAITYSEKICFSELSKDYFFVRSASNLMRVLRKEKSAI
ncbi:hypothetical protein C4K26_5989 [Pseudomonas chlororaphis]|uniref:hypothetical protein n=1 Tax=Pseudomonas chlororaphis TaxID=587753 RepID=UPI000F580B81|nr:hypothetical protein [Pseudomonas chlororaphis]AZD11347.1 hypothetical protein C4K26_5989 [Pseudomonas chlororaphis]